MSAATNKLLDGKYIINRFKGLGEMDPDEVGEMLTDPKNRVLRQLKIEDDAESIKKWLHLWATMPHFVLSGLLRMSTMTPFMKLY